MDTGETTGGDTSFDSGLLSAVSNVLVLAPGSRGDSRSVCLDAVATAELLSPGVIAVTYTSTAQEWIDGWMATVGTPPAHGGILSVGLNPEDIGVGQAGDSLDAVDGDAMGDLSWLVGAVEDPADLTGIGIELSELLSDVGSVADTSTPLVVCFDSLTRLLEHVELERAFRFLHVATARVSDAGAAGLFVLDPETVDAQARETLTGLFDHVVELDG